MLNALPMSHEPPRALPILALIAAIAGLVFIPFLGGISLFDWDEVNFAEIAREMILTGEYSRVYIDFQPFYEKPPMFFWMQALSMHLWGIGEFAARFPNAVCGVVSLCIIYLIGRRCYDHRFGMLWVLAYSGSILPHLYFRSGIIDPWFNLWIFLSLIGLFDRGNARSGIHLCIAGLFLGFAILTKGPVAYLIVLLVVGVYWMLKRNQSLLSLKDFILYSLLAAITFGIWYGIETARNGPDFMIEFMRYQVDLLIKPGAGHSGFPGYHVVVLLLGCFPASVLAIRLLFKTLRGDKAPNHFHLVMLILFWVVLFLFSIVRSKIVHYSSLCYFPLTFLATLYVWRLIHSKKHIGRWQLFGIIAIALIYIVAGAALVVLGSNPGLLEGLIPLDMDTRASLTVSVSWKWWHVLPVVFLVGGMIGLLYWHKRQVLHSIICLYLGTGAYVVSAIFLWTGKIQQYSQGPATEFFTSLRGQDVYVVPWGYKSYSQYWDFQKPLPGQFSDEGMHALKNTSDPHFLLTSPDIDKDVYIITRLSKADQFEAQYPGVKKVGEKGAFVFYLR